MRPSCDVLCAGIVVVDHVHTPIDHLPQQGELVQAERLMLTIGGCAANVAVDLAKMQVAVQVLGCVGTDALGRLVTEMLREQGVDVDAIRTTEEADTSQTLIVNVAGEDRRFIHSFGANAKFSAEDFSADLIKQAKILYVGGYLVMPELRQEALQQVFQQAQSVGVKTVLDVVVPGPGDHLAQLQRLLPHLDVFLPNDHEGEMILGESDPLRQAEKFHKLGAKTCIVTRGQRGAVVVNDHGKWQASSFPVETLDGSGGGDAFTAGYVYGMLQDKSVEDCLRYGSALGASCVQAIGTTTGVFTLEECESFLRENQLVVERSQEQSRE